MADDKHVGFGLPLKDTPSSTVLVRLENALSKLPGLLRARWNADGERLNIVYDLLQTDTRSILEAVETTGCHVPLEEVTIRVEGMTCLACALHVEGALSDIPGVTLAQANLNLANARVEFCAGTVTPSQLQHAVRAIGYEAVI